MGSGSQFRIGFVFTFQGPKEQVVQNPEVDLSNVQVRSD
jgi:hypothetical protein